MSGPTTAYTQQYKMLQDMDEPNPHPRNKFIKDPTKHIQQATTNNEEKILALDANKELLPFGAHKKKHSISSLI